MKRFRHPFFALLLALLLLGSQQAAFAHLISHLGATTESVAKHEDRGHGAALALSHACTTCIAFTAVASGGPASYQAPLLFATVFGEHFCATSESFSPARRIVTCRARAPPVVL
jgi:hypothetical protein